MEAMGRRDVKFMMKAYMDAAQLAGPVGAALKLLSWEKPGGSRDDLAVEIIA